MPPWLNRQSERFVSARLWVQVPLVAISNNPLLRAFFCLCRWGSVHMVIGRRTVVTVAVAGGTGSGKTTFGRSIIERLGEENVAYIPHDAYYKSLRKLAIHQRTEVNFDHPDSLETELMMKHILQLQHHHSIELPIYDYVTDERKIETVHIKAKPVILVEGILILALPTLRDLFDIKIFVDVDSDIRLIRRIQRDMEERGRTTHSIIAQYLKTVRPMHIEFVEPSKRHADIIVPQGGHNKIAVEMIANYVQSMLFEKTN